MVRWKIFQEAQEGKEILLPSFCRSSKWPALYFSSHKGRFFFPLKFTKEFVVTMNWYKITLKFNFLDCGACFLQIWCPMILSNDMLFPNKAIELIKHLLSCYYMPISNYGWDILSSLELRYHIHDKFSVNIC